MGCRRSDEKATLVRLVFDGSAYVVDRRQVAPGRGAYLHPGCGARAVRTRALQRALRVTGGSPSQLATVVAGVDAVAWENRGDSH